MAKRKEALSNFIPISRKLFEHHLWCEDREYSRFEAWLFLLKEARFEDTKVLDKGKLVIVKRGQIYASIRFLATAFGWSTKKVGNYIKILEGDEMVKKETVKETGQNIITICNYDKYNTILSDKETQNETQRKQQGNAEETKSNIENNYNTDNIPPFIPPKGYENFNFSFLDRKFENCLLRWLEYKKTKFQKYKSTESLTIFYNRMVKESGGAVDIAMEMIDQSMANNWDGLFALKQKGGYNEQSTKGNNSNSETRKEYIRQKADRAIADLNNQD